MSYEKFLESKKKKHISSGFEVDESELNENLFDFQKFIVKRALKAGKYAVFADCGLGKTIIQLSWANQVLKRTGRSVLILAPLAVSNQTIEEGAKFGIHVEKLLFGGDDKPGIYISNYEQLLNIDCSLFDGIVLDESSILKNYSGATKQRIIDSFKLTPYKLACTATPSPNDPMELGNHSEFLDIMSRNEMLAMYFVHDGGETAKWRLKKHALSEFYRFVSTWSIMLNNPSDIGFSSKGYLLPKLNLIEKSIETEKQDNGLLFNETAISATNFNRELKRTINKRLKITADIVNNSSETFIIWIKQNAEGELLQKLIPGSVEVKGSDKPEYKESKLLGFAHGEFRVLITKYKIAQFGLNYQNCHNQIVASLDFSFEGLYQAIRRSYRFGQKHEVNIYLIITDTMRNVKESINKKQKDFSIMQDSMCNHININNKDIKKVDTIKNESIKTEYYHIERGDSCKLIKNIENESVGLTVFSPPFAELYTYSDHIEDMGNSKDYKEFLKQFEFLAKDIFRITKQGRNVCVHCMDLPIQKGKEGFIGLRDFSGMILDIFSKCGFIYHSRITIWKNPVTEMQRTKALGLLHKQVKKDSTMSRVGIPDYIMVFRKDGDRSDPVTNTELPVDLWQKYASPVWMDIDYGNTLNGYRNGRHENDEKHICPLQLDTVERLILLYSNEGDIVYTPFLGIGTEVFQAVKMNRYGRGSELKQTYFDESKKNVDKAVDLNKQSTLF